MRLLSRIVLLALIAALLVTVWMMHRNTTQLSIGHETFYHVHESWLHDVREGALFGVLIWGVIFARSDPPFVRVGLVAAILALGLMLLPPKTVHSIEELNPIKAHWH